MTIFQKHAPSSATSVSMLSTELTPSSDRHMTRHRQKDEEAGAEGFGVLNTRKRMWKDAEGKIVTKKPNLGDENNAPPSSDSQPGNQLPPLPDFSIPFPNHEEGAPISPPISHKASGSLSWDDHDSGIGTNYPPTTLNPTTLSTSDSFSPIDQRIWSADLSQPQPEPFISTSFDDAPFDDIFNPDTASSFNNPFTTMSNYNWLFDMDLSKAEQLQHPHMNDPFPVFSYNANTVTQPSHAFDLQLDHMNVDRTLSTVGNIGSLPSQQTDSPQHHSPSAALISPPVSDQQKYEENIIKQARNDSVFQLPSTASAPVPRNQTTLDVERPLSMLVPSRSLPIIDELARQQLLDLVDITQPTAPDGSIVMRDHPLLSLSSLQIYCDLFFTRFNTAYPLIHMSTFDPSEVDTLLLMSVLLLGATYAEKDAHQLAVSKRHSFDMILLIRKFRCASTMFFDHKSLQTPASLQSPAYGCCRLSCSLNALARAELARNNMKCLISFTVC